MIQWSLPLAAEQVINPKIWNRFTKIIIEQPQKILFKDYVNIAWSFAKVGHNDPNVWNLVEENFLKEIKLQQTDPEQ